MLWARFTVTDLDGFIGDVVGVWAKTYWPIADPEYRDNMVGSYQVVRFIDDRRYYVRCVTGNTDYTKTGCLLKPCKTLTGAKVAVEMLYAMQGG